MNCQFTSVRPRGSEVVAPKDVKPEMLIVGKPSSWAPAPVSSPMEEGLKVWSSGRKVS